MATLQLSALNGTTGFRVASPASHYAVTGAGDVNRDGFADVAIALETGTVCVIYGKSASFAASMAVSTIDGSNGFKLTGGPTSFGAALSEAGDINGDGFGDLIIGAPMESNYGNSAAGGAYVVLGQSNFSVATDVHTTAYFHVVGTLDGSETGYAIDRAGDVNADGLDDVVVGTPFIFSDDGAAELFFGKTTGFDGQDVGLGDFRMIGDDFTSEMSGWSVSGAGDINGDGAADMLVSARGAGRTYLVLGGTNLPSYVYLEFNNARLQGSGWNASEAGDVNGDGFGDVLIGDRSSQSCYVVFGHAGPFGTIELTALDGSNGFAIKDTGTGDGLGYSVSSAGDVNGDGYDDVLVGTPRSDANGTDSGAAYIVFGQQAFAAIVNLASLADNAGIRMVGKASGDYAGRTVEAAGDVNGDGFDDVILGTVTGSTYVVFGRDFGSSVPPSNLGTNGPDNIAGGSLGDILSGGIGNDTLNGRGGADVLHGGAGDDLMIVDSLDRRFDGGSGIDTLRLSNAGQVLNLRDFPSHASGIERIDLLAAGHQALVMDYRDLFQLSDSSNALRIDGTAKDSVTLGAGWQLAGTVDIDGQAYVEFTHGQALLQVDADIPRDIAFGLDPSNRPASFGVTFSGSAVDDQVGRWVSDAGDVNGDGFSDFIVGARMPDGSYASYVIYGKASGMGESIEVSTLDGTTASVIAGARSTAAGDVNGDGYADLILGAGVTNPNGDHSGPTYVVFGKASGFGASLDLDHIGPTRGFKLSGAAGDYSGLTVSTAGDINGDGLSDLLIAASGVGTGSAYVVFGKSSGFGTGLDLSALDGGNGFRFAAGWGAVSTAGDVNGDGLADLLVGDVTDAANGIDSGAAYVVFGKTGAFSAVLRASQLSGANGFKLSGGHAHDGAGVVSAGDINGDGLSDIMVGAAGTDPHYAYSGTVYVVYGSREGFASDIALEALNGTNGFRLDGASGFAEVGASVSAAGDVNGDGFDDMLIGALAGAYSCLVFGRADGFAASNELSALSQVVTFQTEAYSSLYFWVPPVSGAGDVNGDGFDDILVGAPWSDTNRGAAYLIYGSDLNGLVSTVNEGTPAADTLTGGAAAEIIVGGDGDDELSGGAGKDALSGGRGKDVLKGGGGADVMRGGSGADTYVVDNLGDRVIEQCAAGRDSVNSRVTYTLGPNLEVLTLTGSKALKGFGNGLDNTLAGNSADNTLQGANGNDSLNGNEGNDRLTGGAGSDAFTFRSALGSENVDTITDFVPGVDKIQLDDDVFSVLGPVASPAILDSDALVLGNAAADAEDRIVYDASTGGLFYDPDGTGPAAMVQFAVLGVTTHPAALAPGDFLVVA